MRPSLLTLLIATGAVAGAALAARIWRTPDWAAATPATGRRATSPTVSTPVARPLSGDPTVTQSPLEAARQMQALHAERAYDRLAARITPDRSQAIVDYLSAVDEVLAADAALHEVVLRVHRVSLPESWNLRVIADNLGLFSTHVKWIGETVDGDRATVTLQEGDHVPLVRAQFERAGGRWLHTPDPPVPATVVELRRLSGVVRDVSRSVEQGASFEELADAFTFRILPQIVRAIQAESEPAASTGPAD